MYRMPDEFWQGVSQPMHLLTMKLIDLLSRLYHFSSIFFLFGGKEGGGGERAFPRPLERFSQKVGRF